MGDEIVPADPWINSSTKEETDFSERTPNQIVTVLKDMKEFQRTLELMHDRCVARNLRAAGLGGFDREDDEKIYGHLNPNAKLPNGESILAATVLHVSDPEKQYRYITILLSEGADPNVVDNFGKTALMHAVSLGIDKCARAIIQCSRTNLLLKDPDENTVLHFIVAFGRDKLLKLFFKALRRYETETVDGSNKDLLDMKNGAGETARSLGIIPNLRDTFSQVRGFLRVPRP